LMIWTGIVFIPGQVGDLVSRALKGLQRIERPCNSCGTEYHDGDAQFCRVCGSMLSPHQAAQSVPTSGQD
ncbi:MAG: hypothetical protein WBA10_20240, partial [Elainellaceae cyanobacterium]